MPELNGQLTTKSHKSLLVFKSDSESLKRKYKSQRVSDILLNKVPKVVQVKDSGEYDSNYSHDLNIVPSETVY